MNDQFITQTVRVHTPQTRNVFGSTSLDLYDEWLTEAECDLASLSQWRWLRRAKARRRIADVTTNYGTLARRYIHNKGSA